MNLRPRFGIRTPDSDHYVVEEIEVDSECTLLLAPLRHIHKFLAVCAHCHKLIQVDDPVLNIACRCTDINLLHVGCRDAWFQHKGKRGNCSYCLQHLRLQHVRLSFFRTQTDVASQLSKSKFRLTLRELKALRTGGLRLPNSQLYLVKEIIEVRSEGEGSGATNTLLAPARSVHKVYPACTHCEKLIKEGDPVLLITLECTDMKLIHFGCWDAWSRHKGKGANVQRMSVFTCHPQTITPDEDSQLSTWNWFLRLWS